jgi:hypothetical protein
MSLAGVSQNVPGPMNPSQQSQLLNQSENQKPPSLMRALGGGGASTNDQRGIKIISQNKIRQSPSPPPNLVINSQVPPTVTNMQVQMKQQTQIQISQQNHNSTNSGHISSNGGGQG